MWTTLPGQLDCLCHFTSWPRDVRVPGVVVSGRYLQLYCLYISKLWCFLTTHSQTTNTATKSCMSTGMWLRKIEVRESYIYIYIYIYIIFFNPAYICSGGRGGAAGWGTAIPNGVIEFFVATLALGSTQRLTECRGYFLGVKADLCVGMTTLPSSRAGCLEICWRQSPGNPRA